MEHLTSFNRKKCIVNICLFIDCWCIFSYCMYNLFFLSLCWDISVNRHSSLQLLQIFQGAEYSFLLFWKFSSCFEGYAAYESTYIRTFFYSWVCLSSFLSSFGSVWIFMNIYKYLIFITLMGVILFFPLEKFWSSALAIWKHFFLGLIFSWVNES